jgi:hypothetical protein
MTTPTREELRCLESAYIAMLQLPDGSIRLTNQLLLCGLRDALAAAMNRSEESVQNEYEARSTALLQAQGEPQSSDQVWNEAIEAAIEIANGEKLSGSTNSPRDAAHEVAVDGVVRSLLSLKRPSQAQEPAILPQAPLDKLYTPVSGDGLVSEPAVSGAVDEFQSEVCLAAAELLRYLDDHDWGLIPEGRTADRLRAALSRAQATQPAQPTFPERDPSKPTEQQGLFRKFIVRRVDGSDSPGGKHYGCRYFVLDLDHDPAAPAGMQGYAAKVRATHPKLADDIEAEFGSQPAQQAPALSVMPWYERKANDRATLHPATVHMQAEIDELRALLSQPAAAPVSEQAVPKEFVDEALRALEWYAGGNHEVSLRGRMDWPAERKKLEDRGFHTVTEYPNGEEVFVEDGSVAQTAIDKLEALLAAPSNQSQGGDKP